MPVMHGPDYQAVHASPLIAHTKTHTGVANTPNKGGGHTQFGDDANFESSSREGNEGDEEMAMWVVDSIMGTRLVGGGRAWLAHWLGGYGEAPTTWGPRESFLGADGAQTAAFVAFENARSSEKSHRASRATKHTASTAATVAATASATTPMNVVGGDDVAGIGENGAAAVNGTDGPRKADAKSNEVQGSGMDGTADTAQVTEDAAAPSLKREGGGGTDVPKAAGGRGGEMQHA